MFSLMDVNGEMTLGKMEIFGFITNILGEQVTEETAQRYVNAMDMDNDGRVSFTDLLESVALLKEKHLR